MLVWPNWVSGHAGVRGNEISDELARRASVQLFVGPEPFSGVSRQNIRRKMKRWMEKQCLVLWRCPCRTQRQARELISGPDLATRVRLLYFNRTQSGVVLACLLDITPWEDIYIKWGWVITPPVGNVVVRRKPQSTFCVSVRPWLHSDIHSWVPSFWALRIFKN
jgi:hypothetical protein